MQSADGTRYGNLKDPGIPAAFSDAVGVILGLSNTGAVSTGVSSPGGPTSEISPNFSGGNGVYFGAAGLHNFYNENPNKCWYNWRFQRLCRCDSAFQLSAPDKLQRRSDILASVLGIAPSELLRP